MTYTCSFRQPIERPAVRLNQLIDANLNHRASFRARYLPHTKNIVYPHHISYLTYILQRRRLCLIEAE